MSTPNRATVGGVPTTGTTTPTVGARAGVSGTVHHLAPGGTVRATTTPFANLQQGILAMQSAQKSNVRNVTAGATTTKILHDTDPSPRKKIKIEEVPAATDEISATRKLIVNERYTQMRTVKENYFENLTECFFLQNGGQLMDYYNWRKRPTPELVHFLKSGRLDSEDEDENPVIYLKERRMADEVKASLPSTTPVATSTTLPASVAALSQGGRHGMVFGHINPPPLPAIHLPVVMTVTVTAVTPVTHGRPVLSGSGTGLPTTTGAIHRSVSDSRLLSLAQSTKTSTSLSTSTWKSPNSPGKQNTYDGTNIKGISTQEAIVERAKQEAQVMSRVVELRKEGLWSSRRLPKVQEPPRTKAHWDYLLEEMQWLAADFLQERKWKKTCSRKIAKMVQKHFMDLEQKGLRAEKEESMKLKRIAGQMAKMIKEFWTNIEKVVQYKQNSRLDEKRKKAMDLHLNFIVDQTEKYSTWLSEGLTQSSKGSSVGSLNTTPDHSVAGDDEFKPEGGDTDDEETIDKDEQGIDESETRDEVAALQKESEMSMDELIDNLPKEILEKPADLHDESSDEDDSEQKEDEEFKGESEEDVEDSIAEQEKHEKQKDIKKEIDDLQDEGEMTIDELRAKYSAAYDDDFEMPDDSGDESTDINDSDDDETEDEEESEEEEEDVVDIEGDDVGLEELVKAEEQAKPKEKMSEPGDELVDIAAQAASLQPKGYTLQTAEVKTTVPFLLKHTLREYQHVGLDWLATMYEKRLNGILADEMGLGKTIQTIALLAHLACEKGIWGPHLIVVPTSVMLNWEMELKKWAPAFKILTYYGSQKERKQKRTGWTKTNAFHVCITSYKLVIQDHQAFRRKKWKYLILDEAQNIKNFKSQRWQTLLNFNSMRRLLLTGTPLQNSLMELWSLMHFLMPHVFQSHKDFKEWFANPLTGMIEGSHEYNESLIRRLHKVLRPFLLRRLKDDVEKQMPKKYEHIVMCHLSKRQRFLYDEFMAQGKTKETLASGHFMSVINILMQLRKVCNHPSLFDPRPIISPFQMQGIVYTTASLVLKVLLYNPLEHIDLHHYPGLAEMERDLPAFIAHRVRKLQTSRRLIEEIDIQPPPPPRPQSGKLKQNSIRCVSPAIQSGRASPAVLSRSVSPAPVIKVPSHSTPVTTVPGTSQQPPLQAAALVPPTTVRGSTPTLSIPVSSTVTSQPPTSAPITVQIQHTDQGTRLVVPSGQLSQLPGFIQIVQTSTGQHLIATSTHTSSPLSSTTVVNGCAMVTTAMSTVRTMVSSVVSQVKMSPGVTSTTSSSTPVHLPTQAAATSIHPHKPVMRVSPLTEPSKHVNGGGVVFTPASTSLTTSSVMSTTTKPISMVTPQLTRHWQEKKKRQSKTEFYNESMYEKKHRMWQEKLNLIARLNKQHCEVKPVYGQDLCEAIDIFKDPYSSKTYRTRDTGLWHGPGHIHCQCAKLCDNPHHPKYVWNRTKVLSDIIHSPEQYLYEMEDVLQRFVFATPHVQSQPLQMHTSHPPPTYRRDEVYRDYTLRAELSPKAVNYHQISTKMTVQFPELRLIQYDCGKLQTMDILLRRLKSGDHRVLVFTQMTRMLDILEAFLNYHGYRYLRLDGTTKVEQRQLLMDRFNADRRIFVFILSTRSGGIGVNLTGADTVIFYDSDWNPTMDAQAQDRCHRIGQTRDVHIYRLVSERTVEENILKKANQKRMLGDMAIEGGNFTTAFFKENTISELFSEPSGLESFVQEKEKEQKMKEIKKVEKVEKKTSKKQDPAEKEALVQFEKALAKTEDETDAVAIDQVKAEQKAELAEFDENIPWDEKEAELREGESHVEMELAMLDKELSPIERYAVHITEQQMEPVNNEELLNAEEDIELVKENWELNRLKALKEEEERRAEMEEDEMLYTYSRDDAYQQVFLSDIDQEQMPMWAPPTPPHDDNDVYIDETLLFLYEPTVMPETQLPPIYIKKEKKKVKIESITTRKQKQRKEEQPRVPRSLFDRPTAQLLKLRRDAKMQKLKLGQMKPYRPLQQSMPTNKPVMEQASDHPEWLIHEDWALLQAVQTFFDVPLNLMIVNPAHTPNWDMVANVVNSCSRVYRSTKQCRLRYETVIIPREEGLIMYDMNPRKQKKQKGIYKMAKSNRAMKTGQIHSQDSNNRLTILYSLRFDSVKSIATKRPPTMRQTLVNPTLKNPKHASVLQENSITYDQPLNPMQVAEIRAQRIQREKKQNQQQQAAAAAAGDQASVATPTVGGVQRPAQTVIPQVSSTPTILVTTAVTAAQLATIGTAVPSATVLTVTGTPLGQATIRQRAPLTVQDITASTGLVGQVTGTQQVRAPLQTGTTTVTTGAPLTPVQLAQRITAATTGAGGATVQQQLAAGKTSLTQQQFQMLQQQQQNLLRQKQQQAALQQQQQQQLRMQKLTLTEPMRPQTALKLRGPVIPGQKTVIAQQLVTNMQQVKPGQLKTPPGTLTRPLTAEELTRLKQTANQRVLTGQQVAGTSVAQIHHPQTGQIIAQTPLQVSQALSKVTGPQSGATLVKTVTAPAGVTLPVSNVSINVSMPQKGGVAKMSQITPQQMHLLQQRKQPIPVQKGLGQKVNAPMLNAVQIIQQQGAGRLTVQQLHQLMKQQPQGATIQQIIHTSQPTIIATVTQSQATPQMVTKVIATSNPQPTHLQTITASPASISGVVSGNQVTQPVSLSHLPSLNITSIAPVQSSMTASIVKPGGLTGTETVTTVQIHPITSISQSKLGSIVVQPVQHVTVPASVPTQTHMPLVAQQVTVATPSAAASQTLQVTMPVTSQIQSPVYQHHGQTAATQHVTVTAQRTTTGQTPLTVTVNPTIPTTPAVALSVHTPTHTTVSHPPVTYINNPTVAAIVTATPPQATPTQATPIQSNQPHTQTITITDQTAQQTVTTLLQPQRVTQPTVQVQHTPSPLTLQTTQQTPSNTIHIQSQSPGVSHTQPATLGTAAGQTAAGQTGPQTPGTPGVQTGTTSPQTTPSGKAPYGMRTRKQSHTQ